MELRRRTFLRGAAIVPVAGVLGLAAGCKDKTTTNTSGSTTAASLTFDGKAWNYDAANDVYWQLGKYYVASPAAKDYETLAVIVPGAYLTKGTRNSDGTFAATVNAAGTVAGFTASTAPIVFPVDTPGYAAQKPLTTYTYADVSSYLQAGFVYVHAGLRGKDSNTTEYSGNAPWGVTDLKAAVRYVRYNAAVIPGSKDRMVVFGMSGGGAQSAIAGASGDSALYTPYLQKLGAAMNVGDAVAGAMCWCPITGLDYANASYEWNMGQFAATGTRAAGTWTAAYSKDLAAAWAGYQNKLGLKDASGKPLTLTKSSSGVYLSGSYYDHLLAVVNESLNNFLKDTKFPYTPSSSFMAGMTPGGGAPGGGAPGGGAPGGGAMPSGGPGAPGGSAKSTTYKTAQEYFAHLNSTGAWVIYNAATNTAKVTSLAGFVKSQKSPSKTVGAFDGPGRSVGENIVLGSGTSGLHFSPVSKDVMTAGQNRYSSLGSWQPSFGAAAYESDFKQTDSVGSDVADRLNAYNPMYYLNAFYDGYQKAQVAPHWRIRTGIMQGDTASTTEVNLALALQNYGVTDVDFATVWGLGHTMAERTGDATANFISWVTTTVAK